MKISIQTFAVVLTLVISGATATAGSWGWDRDAGAKARGEFGSFPTRSTQRGYTQWGLVGSSHTILAQSPAVETRQSFSYEPAPRPGVKAGDTIVVTSDAAKLMRGTEAVVSVPKGQKLLITAVQPSWLGVSVIVNGKTYSGWISTTDVQRVPTAPAALH